MKKLFLAALAAVIVCGCNSDPAVYREDWAPDVKAGINDFLATYKGQENAYVVFDFDNTCSIFDIEDQASIYQLETMSFALDPDGFRTAISTGMETAPEEAQDWIADISDAYGKLYAQYGPFTPEGVSDEVAQTLGTDPCWLDFASKMRLFYDLTEEWCTPEIWHINLLFWYAGMTDKQVYDLSRRAYAKYSKADTHTIVWRAPDDYPSRLGARCFEWVNGIQVTANIKELWKALKAAGIDIWVCSASDIQQVTAAVDEFGLHGLCKGVLAMTMKTDSEGLRTVEYDCQGKGSLATKDGWKKDYLPTGALTAGPGKVTAIINSIAFHYNSNGPLAGFMDSTGDLNFCTEFSSLKMVVCFNRANRTIYDGGGLIAEVAIHQRDNLGYDLKSANANGDTMYLLQGRDENGQRTFRPSNSTVIYGETAEKLFDSEANSAFLTLMKIDGMSTADAINTYSALVIPDYHGYHSR